MYFTVAFPKTICFKDLHDLIQLIMGWKDYHLHDFLIQDMSVRIVINDMIEEYPNEATVPESRAKLSDYEGRTFVYSYDYGDGWRLKIEFREDYTGEASAPLLLQFRGIAPEDDSGGVWDFNQRNAGKKSCILPASEVDEINKKLRLWHTQKTEGRSPRLTVPPALMCNLPVALGIAAENELYIETDTGKIYSRNECDYYPVSDRTEGMLRIPPDLQVDYEKLYDCFVLYGDDGIGDWFDGTLVSSKRRGKPPSSIFGRELDDYRATILLREATSILAHKHLCLITE